ncbi:hypothetical protein AB838_22030 [Rhodobacteraceae bacterium (ex Bugula neritina AB1)]|nr:hypothetical protein AB838_22030 [Rhodobacteraceae bacterium (ex Bugula neritina AB1)]
MTKTYTIGVAGPFSGPRAAYGEMLKRAAGLSAGDFSLIFEDDCADTGQARAAARRLVSAGVDAVIGHFNSDCARVAGSVYRAAGIPFLMPASTASNLVAETGGYRICAPDDAQVDALAAWMRQRGLRMGKIWCDGSPYADRLQQLIQQRCPMVEPGREPQLQACLGAHHNVALELQEGPQTASIVFVPDDCAIAEFAELAAGTRADLLCAVATPDFETCVTLAMTLLHAAADSGLPLAAALQQMPSIEQGQYRYSGFRLDEMHFGATLEAGALQ